jgi:hypothetical protein
MTERISLVCSTAYLESSRVALYAPASNRVDPVPAKSLLCPVSRPGFRCNESESKSESESERGVKGETQRPFSKIRPICSRACPLG